MGKHQEQIKQLQKENITLDARNKEVLLENKQLKEDNDSHVKLAKSFINNQNTESQIKNLTEENKQLQEEAQKKDKKIADQQKSVSLHNGRMTEKNREIKLLKTQISSLEDRLGELDNAKEIYKRDLDVKTVDYEREKELNNLLTQRQNKSGEIRMQVPKENDADQEARRKRRGLCCHEVLKKDSCPFLNCMFTHMISDDDRNDPAKVANAEKKKSTVQIRNKQNDSKTDHLDICETVFHGGEGSCKAECTKHHNLDFERIKRGVCHLYVLGKCYRQNKCWFTHEIPTSIKEDNVTIQAAANFLKYREQSAEAKPVKNTKIATATGERNDTDGGQKSDERTNNAMSSPRDMETSAISLSGNDQNQAHSLNTNYTQQELQHQLKPKNQPQHQLPSHDPFLLQIKAMIQDQFRELMSQPQTVQYPQYYPAQFAQLHPIPSM